MHIQRITTALLTLLIPVMAVPIQDKRDDTPKGCPKDTTLKIFSNNGQKQSICLQKGEVCIDAYSDFTFKGSVFSHCALQVTCTNIPHDSGVWGEVSSFKQQGKTSLDDGKSIGSKVACLGYFNDDCKGEFNFWVDRWEKAMLKGYQFWGHRTENDRMKSYICWNPVEWWGNGTPPPSVQSP